MTMKEILLVLWVLGVMAVKFLFAHFASHALFALENCFAVGLVSFSAFAHFLFEL
jgi:hypothetical protein